MDNNIKIKNLIVHKVYHRKFDSAQLSDLETPIPEDVEIFLRDHIVSHREHRFTNIANFVEPENGQPVFKGMCDILLNNPGQFIDQSKNIANHLFGVVSKNKAISDSDLVICTFQEGEANSPIQLALLKMDPKVSFVGERVFVGGKAYIVLKPVGDVLPTTALQKCAFILPGTLREKKGYDLKVLDMQQKRYGVQQQVASFFTKDFIQCEVPPSSVDQTELYINKSVEWVTNKSAMVPDEKKTFTKNVTDSILKNTVDVVTFAEENINTKEEKDDYIDYMKDKGLPVLTFTPSPEVKARFSKYAVFYGDNKLRIQIQKNDVGEGKMMEVRKDAIVGNYVITIRTINWQEK